MLEKVKFAIKEYGAVGVGIYAGLWVAPFSAVYFASLANGNFGIDPLHLLDKIGAKETVLNAFSMPLDATLEPWQTALILGFVAADALELARVPATLYLAPKVKRMISPGSAGTSPAGHQLR